MRMLINDEIQVETPGHKAANQDVTTKLSMLWIYSYKFHEFYWANCKSEVDLIIRTVEMHLSLDSSHKMVPILGQAA